VPGSLGWLGSNVVGMKSSGIKYKRTKYSVTGVQLAAVCRVPGSLGWLISNVAGMKSSGIKYKRTKCSVTCVQLIDCSPCALAPRLADIKCCRDEKFRD
jgi:hypothetical protein